MYLLKENSKIYFSNSKIEEVKKIPASNWILLKDDVRGFYISEIPNFSIPERIYGDLVIDAQKFLETFSERNLGILLTGITGSGKSLMTRYISNKLSCPRIIVSQYYSGADFNNFVLSLKGEVCFIFDEFEKVYDSDEKQNELLSILDGLVNSESKRLFIFTSNSKNLSRFLMNRPGRIHYHKHFGGLSEDEVEEIVEDLVTNDDYKDELIELSGALGEISMDTLLAWIKEINKFNQSPREAMKLLNISVENARYHVILMVNGARFVTEIEHHPLQYLEYPIYYRDTRNEQRWAPMESYKVNLAEVEKIYSEGRITLESKKGSDTIIFQKIKEQKLEL